MSYESRLFKLESRSGIKPNAGADYHLELTVAAAENVREILLEIGCLVADGSESNVWVELCKQIYGQPPGDIE